MDQKIHEFDVPYLQTSWDIGPICGLKILEQLVVVNWTFWSLNG